jgi:hypothetical protein
MAKKKIHVKDEELIKTLNENLSRKNTQESKNEEVVPTVEPDTEPDTEPEAVSTEENVSISDNDEPDWKSWERIESDLQRQLKYNSYKDKGYANACPNNSWSHTIKNTDSLVSILGPQISDMFKRVNDIDTVMDDNAVCRQTIEKECGNPIFDESSNIINDKPVSNELKRILNTSKQLSDKIKDIKNSSNKKTMSNDVESVISDILSPKKDLTLITDEYEMVDHPQHYNNYEYEVIDMMRKIYGDEKTAIFCELNAFKYRMRMGTKPTSPIDEDLKKEQWYLKKKKEILNNKIIIKTDKGTL